MHRVLAFTGVLALSALTVTCVGTGAVARSTAARTLGEAVPSAIERFPIPSTADDVGDEQLDDKRIQYRGRKYDLGTDVSARQVRAWYASQALVGNDWRGWHWCRVIAFQGGASQYLWRDEGTGRMLSLEFGRNKDDMASFSGMRGHLELLVATYPEHSTQHANPGCG